MMVRWPIYLALLLSMALACLAQEATEQTTPDLDPSLVVQQIQVEGLQNQEESLVLGLIETKVGEEISSETLSKDIRTLYRDTGLFADVQVDVSPRDEGGLLVRYIVRENPKMEGEVKLIDLGFARPVGAPQPRCRGDLMTGTAEYLAPETLARGPMNPVAGDMYSLGVMLFRMLTGRLPFAEELAADVLRQQRQSKPPLLRRWCPEAPRELAGLVP